MADLQNSTNLNVIEHPWDVPEKMFMEPPSLSTVGIYLSIIWCLSIYLVSRTGVLGSRSLESCGLQGGASRDWTSSGISDQTGISGIWRPAQPPVL